MQKSGLLSYRHRRSGEETERDDHERERRRGRERERERQTDRERERERLWAIDEQPQISDETLCTDDLKAAYAVSGFQMRQQIRFLFVCLFLFSPRIFTEGALGGLFFECFYFRLWFCLLK